MTRQNEGVPTVLSGQERAIVDGKKVMHGTATDRVLTDRCAKEVKLLAA